MAFDFSRHGLTDDEAKKLSDKVAQIERTTTGEVVPAVAGRSVASGALPDWYTSLFALLAITAVYAYEKSVAFPLHLDSVLFGLAVAIVVWTLFVEFHPCSVCSWVRIGERRPSRIAQDLNSSRLG